jgi:hypothetical protein
VSVSVAESDDKDVGVVSVVAEEGCIGCPTPEADLEPPFLCCWCWYRLALLLPGPPPFVTLPLLLLLLLSEFDPDAPVWDSECLSTAPDDVHDKIVNNSQGSLEISPNCIRDEYTSL